MKNKAWPRECQLLVREGLYYKETCKHRSEGSEGEHQMTGMSLACSGNIKGASVAGAEWAGESGGWWSLSFSIMRGAWCQVQKVRLLLPPPLQCGPQIISSAYNLACDVTASIGYSAVWSPPPVNFNLIWEISSLEVTGFSLTPGFPSVVGEGNLRFLKILELCQWWFQVFLGVYPKYLEPFIFMSPLSPFSTYPPPLLKILICAVKGASFLCEQDITYL